MKKILFGLLIPVIFGSVSCKKEGTTPAPVKFMSFTAGSTWNYKFTDNTLGSSSNYTVTSLGTDSVASGRSYKIFTNSSGPNEYYNITGSNYYTFRGLKTSFIDTALEVLYLKDDLALNATWEQSFPFSVDFFGTTIPLTLKFTNKIAQKGISKTVNGTVYTDVTDVETTLTLTGSPIPVNITTDIHYYYAPKFGQIENKTIINITATGITPTNINQKTELQSSNIL